MEPGASMVWLNQGQDVANCQVTLSIRFPRPLEAADRLRFGFVMYNCGRLNLLPRCGVRFWLEMANGQKVYFLSGSSLTSSTTIEGPYPCREEEEKFEFALKGRYGWVRSKDVKLHWGCSVKAGRLGIFNESTLPVFFQDIAISPLPKHSMPLRITTSKTTPDQKLRKSIQLTLLRLHELGNQYQHACGFNEARNLLENREKILKKMENLHKNLRKLENQLSHD